MGVFRWREDLKVTSFSSFRQGLLLGSVVCWGDSFSSIRAASFTGITYGSKRAHLFPFPYSQHWVRPGVPSMSFVAPTSLSLPHQCYIL